MGLFDEFLGKKASSASQGTNTGKKLDTKDIYDTGEETLANSGAGAKEIKNSPLGNWYKQKPYAFEFGEEKHTFYLPISPSNINITTHFATNVISTMYGTVEEHSEQRYFDITITGTTGMSPRFYKEINSMVGDETKTVGRAGAPVKSRVSGRLGGFLRRTQDLVQNTLNQVNDVIGDQPEPSTGVDLKRTGYAAFHAFYKFLLAHKQFATSAAGSGEQKTLKFINYKDNNMYDVAIQQFQLVRDSANPMLYNYNIVMRAYNLRTAGDSISGIQEIQSRAAELGLVSATTDEAGVESSSLFSKISNKASGAKNAAYSVIGAVRGFGS